MLLRPLVFALAVLVGVPALAAAPDQVPADLTTTETNTLDAAAMTREAEDYFRSLKTAKARFVQTAPDGTQRVGTFYLNRPGKLRFEYDAPVKDMVVADGLQLFFYDGELKQTSSAPVGQTLADFLLRKDIKLSGDIRVMGVQDAAGLKQIILTQTADPGAGTMTIGFRDGPFGLKKWRITDGTGSITEVELFDVQENIALPGSLFVYRDPQHPKGRYND
jgi:outer membrane lipoprotein-sorting protein